MMICPRPYMDWPIYGLGLKEKSLLLAAELTRLTWRHAACCAPYARILGARGISPDTAFDLEQVPFIPVQLFKNYDLMSISPDQVFKVITSSGTMSQQVSRIFLDRDTSMAQTRALVLIFQQFLGKARLPMLIIDHPGVIKNQHSFSVRGAGILGISSFGRDHTYALRDDDLTPDFDAISAFVERHKGSRMLLFGFTFMVWKFFHQVMKEMSHPPRFTDAILVHGGGWKKMMDENIDNTTFKSALFNRFNLAAIHDFYGMVEQAGSVFVECEQGRLHAPVFADILVRDARDWSVLPEGRRGLLQVLSLIPTSYPGHSLLTEDVGELTGIDDCPCGRLGRTFLVHGRIRHAEQRGCSDTHSSRIGWETGNGKALP